MDRRSGPPQQEPAANHPRCRRCGPEKTIPRIQGRAHARTRRIGRRLRDILPATDEERARRTKAAWLVHAVEETALWLLLVAADLRLSGQRARLPDYSS